MGIRARIREAMLQRFRSESRGPNYLAVQRWEAVLIGLPQVLSGNLDLRTVLFWPNKNNLQPAVQPQPPSSCDKQCRNYTALLDIARQSNAA